MGSLTVFAGTSDNSAMTVYASRLPFKLDALIGEARSRASRRRLCIGIGVVLLVGLLGGLMYGLRSPGSGPSTPLTGRPVTARYPGLSLRYPSGWTRVRDCGAATWSVGETSSVTPDNSAAYTGIAFLTTGRAPAMCQPHAHAIPMGFFPTGQQLPGNGLSVEVARVAGALALPGTNSRFVLPPGARLPRSKARLGQPAFAASPFYSSYFQSQVCPVGVRREYRHAAIPSGNGIGGVAPGAIGVVAVICGPNLTAGNAAIDRILASLHVTD